MTTVSDNTDAREADAREADARERLVAKLLAERGIRSATGSTIPRRSPEAVIPLSGAQRGLWFTEQLGQDGGAYVMQEVIRLVGDFDLDAFTRAVRAVVARHEALRSYVIDREGVPVQVVARPDDPRLDGCVTVVDLREHPAAERERVARQLAGDEGDRPFRLDTPPLLRATVLRLDADDHVLALCVHHILVDDVSVDILISEVAHCYGAFVAGQPPRLAELTAQFPDFVLWQAERLDGGERERQLDYWRERLAGAPAVHELPTDRPRPARRTVRGAGHPFTVPAELATRLASLGNEHDCTLFATLLAGFGVLMSRYSGQVDVVVGAPTTRRPAAELDAVIGMFVNSLALRLDLSGDPTVAELLARAKETSIGALSNAEVPFEQVAAAVHPQRDLAYHPVFQVMLVLNQAGVPGQWPGLRRRPFASSRGTSRFDITVVFVHGGESLQAVIDYSTDLFEADTIARMAEHLLAVLATMAADPHCRVSELDLCADADRTALAAVNDNAAAFGPARNLAELIAEQAARTPDATAVLALGGSGALSYRELDSRADRVALELCTSGVGPEVPVVLAIKSEPDAIVGLLAVLKAGGCYVPLDPGLPPRRLAAVLADCAAPVLITTPVHRDRFADFSGHLLDTGHPAFRDEGRIEAAPGPGRVSVAPGQLAYVIYTSGSTGAPKGVMVQHDTLHNLTMAFVDAHGFGPGQRVLMIPPLFFDASVGDVFPALVSGATLVLHPEPAALSGPELLRLVAEHGITAVDTASALWRRWVEDLVDVTGHAGPVEPSTLGVMMVGGEAVPAAALRDWAKLTGGRVAFYNHYGPTEATVCAALYRTMDGAELGAEAISVPVGHPLPNVRAHVLDGNLRPCPVGVPGELYVGGAAPVRGYLGQPALTAAAFLPDPFDAEPGRRLYRTGDLVRLCADGTLQFLGRADEQVKIRGNRIELAEVRAAMAEHPRVVEAAAVVREGVLVGYLVARPGEDAPDATQLRAFCAERLPEYMLPSTFVALEELPLTRSGKLDTAALPAPASTDARPPYVAPRTPVERTVAEIWADVLQTPGVGRHDSFFGLGGHSLLAAPVLVKVRAVLGVTLPLSALFATADLSELAAVIEQARVADDVTFAKSYRAAIPPVTQLRTAAIPPYDIVPAGPVTAGEPANVLLTGATGFLGAHLLAELLGRTNADVHCLVRAESPAVGTARLLANLRRARIELPADQLARIVPLPGDMARPRFGLDEGTHERLCEELDAVYHNGAVMNFVLTYDWLMPPHVNSTVTALRLATRRRTKPLHLMSTLGVYLGSAYNRQLIKETDSFDDPSGLATGYHTTKWVADKMAVNARERGLPVSVYRIAAIVGDVRTGTAKTDSYLSRQIASCVNVGAVPVTDDVIDMLPVDRLAAAIVHQSTAHLGRDFHFYRANGFTYADLGKVLTEAGHPCESLPYPRWRERMLEATETAFAPLAYGLPAPGTGRYHPVFDCTATWEAAAGGGVTFPPADAVMMRRHVDFLTTSGALSHGREQKD